MARRAPVSLALQPRAPRSLALFRLFTGSIDWAAAMATTYLPARLPRGVGGGGGTLRLHQRALIRLIR